MSSRHPPLSPSNGTKQLGSQHPKGWCISLYLCKHSWWFIHNDFSSWAWQTSHGHIPMWRKLILILLQEQSKLEGKSTVLMMVHSVFWIAHISAGQKPNCLRKLFITDLKQRGWHTAGCLECIFEGFYLPKRCHENPHLLKFLKLFFLYTCPVDQYWKSSRMYFFWSYQFRGGFLQGTGAQSAQHWNAHGMKRSNPGRTAYNRHT